MNKTYIKTNLAAFSMMGLLCFFVTTANSQEKTFDVNYEDTNTETVESAPTKTNITEIEYSNSELINSKTPVKKPISTATASKNPEQKAKKEPGTEKTKTENATESESVLSFNFLYYIIQKFKFTEIVDQ